MALPASPENVDLMQFLQQDCPEDVLPKILAFCGPQKVAALSQTCTAWRDIILDDSTWRILCEELYKVRMRGMLVIVALMDEDSLVIGHLKFLCVRLVQSHNDDLLKCTLSSPLDSPSIVSIHCSGLKKIHFHRRRGENTTRRTLAFL
jgi:hypothetical protein